MWSLSSQPEVCASGLSPRPRFIRDTLRVDRADLMRLPCRTSGEYLHCLLIAPSSQVGVSIQKGPTCPLAIQGVSTPIGTRGKTPGGRRFPGLHLRALRPTCSRHVGVGEDPSFRPVARRA